MSSTQCILAKAYPVIGKFLCQTEKPKNTFFLPFSPTPSLSFYLRHFRVVFDSRSSFFAPKLHGSACGAGYGDNNLAWCKRTLLKTVSKTGFVCIEGNKLDGSPRHIRQVQFEKARKELHGKSPIYQAFNKVISHWSKIRRFVNSFERYSHFLSYITIKRELVSI